VAFAVNVGDVATPEAFVATVAVTPPPVNVPLAPEPGAVKVTLAPGTGLLPESMTVAVRGLPKAVLTCAFWPLPEVAAMVVGAPAAIVMLND
jgi:hypothetical protein